MHLPPIDWIIALGCVVLCFAPALFFARRAGRNTAQFFVSGRSVPWWLAGLSMVATTFSSDTPNLVTDEELTTLRQLKELTPLQASAGPPVRLRGVVLCYDAGWHQLYINDGRETLYFNADDFATQPAVGQAIELTGRARGTNVLENSRLAMLGPAALPTPTHLGLARLAEKHGEWIEINGRVMAAETTRGRLALLLQENQRNCLVYVLGGPTTNDFEPLLQRAVRVRGINASRTKSSRLELGLVFAPGLDAVTVLESAGARPALVPVVSIGSLLNRELGSWTNQPVHVNGLVVSYQPGESIVVKDPTGVISGRIMQLTELRANERVDLWGFLEASPEQPLLNSAYFTVVPAPPQEPAVLPSANATAEAPATVLTHLSDISKLPRDEAAQSLPVRARGVITYADLAWRNGFIQDKTEAVFVYLNPSATNLEPGAFVELTGQTSPGGFAPEVLASKIDVLGYTNLPNPARVDLQDLANGHLDAHWVEMEGVVRRVEEQAGHANVSLMTAQGRFNVIIPGFENKPLPTHLIDALVSVQGACISELNVKRQLSGITLHVPSLQHVKIFEAPPPDPFVMPATRIDAVATFDPERLAGRRIKVQGVVTLRLPGQGFILQDATGGLRVLTRQTNAVAIGDAVEVLGFPAIGDFSPFLEEGVWRRSGSGSLPAPARATAEQILLHGTNDAQLVEVRARLLQSVPRSANPQFVLQDGSIIFTAHLQTHDRPGPAAALASGSLLSLTGVCSIQGGETHEPAAFRLLLRRPEDIELLETPPWWTSRHALALGGGMMLAIIVTSGWVTLLRRQVRTQTNLIRQKLQDEAALEQRYRNLFENANDIVFTHDRDGCLTSINETGARLLQMPREELLGRHLIDLVARDHQAAARQWLESVMAGAAAGNSEWDFVSASGQRVKLEISARVIEQAGRFIEVEGIARDITERKRLEREVLEISNREQRRIGHDLHDGVCQQLAGIAFMTSTLADELNEKGVTESAEAERISDMINQVIDQTRGVARGLFPVRLEEHGLAVALEELAANASELFKVNCRFVAQNPPAAWENPIALHLYYIALEAVANAAKHGGAANVEITLEQVGDRCALRVRDDGCGFVPSAAPHAGMGLRIMDYRARVISASLSLQSRPGFGTTVSCLFQPVSRDNAAAPSQPKAAREPAAKTLG